MPRSYRGKRLLDVALVTLSIPITAPVSLICALWIKLGSRGSVLFRQERIGMMGQPFRIVKFRTMVTGSEANPLFPHNQAITVPGRLLRRTGIDELPQLYNVLRGDMSIVGPRPTLAYQVARYSPRQRERLTARPGITGLAQVMGRNSLSWADRIEFDLTYCRRQSLWLDLEIIARTLGVLARGSGAAGHPLDDPLAMVRD